MVAQFEGTVSASKGIIGGFTTDGSSFSDNNGQIFISGSPAVGGNITLNICLYHLLILM